MVHIYWNSLLTYTPVDINNLLLICHKYYWIVSRLLLYRVAHCSSHAASPPPAPAPPPPTRASCCTASLPYSNYWRKASLQASSQASPHSSNYSREASLLEKLGGSLAEASLLGKLGFPEEVWPRPEGPKLLLGFPRSSWRKTAFWSARSRIRAQITVDSQRLLWSCMIFQTHWLTTLWAVLHHVRDIRLNSYGGSRGLITI